MGAPIDPTLVGLAPSHFLGSIVTRGVGAEEPGGRAGRYWKMILSIAKDIVYQNRLAFPVRAQPRAPAFWHSARLSFLSSQPLAARFRNLTFQKTVQIKNLILSPAVLVDSDPIFMTVLSGKLG